MMVHSLLVAFFGNCERPILTTVLVVLGYIGTSSTDLGTVNHARK